MNRSRIIFAGLAVGTLALLAVGVYFLMSSAAAAREARVRRDDADKRLAALYRANPFPDAANTERMNQQVLLLEQMRDTMTNALAARDIPQPELSPSRFIQTLQRTLRDRLLPEAPIVEGGRVVPDGFTFGFERYLAANAPMPAEADVPRLAQQLTMVENLVGEVYAAQVVALRSIEREVFESSAEDTGAAETRRSRGRGGRGSTPSTAAPVRSAAQSSELYSSQRFTLVVKGRQASIGTLLNRLACMPMFVVVRDVELRKKSEDLRPPPSDDAPAAGDAAQPVSLFAAPQEAPADAAAATTGSGGAAAENEVSDLPPARRLVSGREIDPVIEARIELDVFNFNRGGV